MRVGTIKCESTLHGLMLNYYCTIHPPITNEKHHTDDEDVWSEIELLIKSMKRINRVSIDDDKDVLVTIGFFAFLKIGMSAR